MLRVVAIATAAVCFAVASPAQAGWKIQRAQAIASAVWHHPCNDQVTLEWADVQAGATGEAFADQCRIVFPTAHTSWVTFCTTMIHEYGHLAGYRDWSNTADPLHSSNPHSVMAADTISTEGVIVPRHGKPIHLYAGLDKRCADNGRTYLHMKPDSLARRERFTPGPSQTYGFLG